MRDLWMIEEVVSKGKVEAGREEDRRLQLKEVVFFANNGIVFYIQKHILR